MTLKFLTGLLALLLGHCELTAQFTTGDNTSAAEFDRILKAADRATRDLTALPPAYSLKKYAPAPQQQGLYGTCVAWSSAYAARTISYAVQKNMQHPDSIKKYAFSPGYLYYKIKPATDANCSAGTSILAAMQEMSSGGAALKNTGIPDCTGSLPDVITAEKTSTYKIRDYLALNKTFDSITKNEILKIKKSLSEKKPVVLSMKVFSSFERVMATGTWTPGNNEPVKGRHAVCLVGYDDKKAGGSFELINSWGTRWGNKGFGWITYQQVMKYGNYIVEMMDYETGKTSIAGMIEFIETDEQNREKTMPVVRDQSSAEGKEGLSPVSSFYRLVNSYSAGTRFKLKFNSAAPCYMYVFAQDTRGEISRLFPPDPSVSAAVNAPNATYYFPSDSTHARLDHTVGKENFCILYSKGALDLEELLNHIRVSGVSIFQAVKDKLGPRLLNPQKMQFRTDKMSFQGPAEEGAVLCLFAEMNHQ